VSILMVVVLPAPLGPNSPKMVPRGTLSINSLTAVTAPKRRVNAWASTAGGSGVEFTSPGATAEPAACSEVPVSGLIAFFHDTQKLYGFMLRGQQSLTLSPVVSTSIR
jgi:hypothetical protein